MAFLKQHSKGYEPSLSALKFNGSRDAWPNYQWQLRATINTFGEYALPLLDGKFEDVITKTKTALAKVKAEAKGDQDAKDAIYEEVDKRGSTRFRSYYRISRTKSVAFW